MSEFRAHFAYKAMGEGEVSLLEGEVVKVIAQHDEHGDDLWWQIEKSDGSTGVVPGAYLVENDADGPAFEATPSASLLAPSPTPDFKTPEPVAEHEAEPEPAAVPEPTKDAPPSPEPAVSPVPEAEPKEAAAPARPSGPPARPTVPPAAGSLANLPIFKNRADSSFSTDSMAFGQSDYTPPPASASRFANLSRATSTLSTMSVDSVGLVNMPEGVQETDPRFATGEEFISVTLSDPKKEGMVSKVLSWNLVVQTNLPGFHARAYQIRRRYSDFLWIHEYLTWDLFDVIVPPIPEENSTVKMTTVDEYFIGKRTLALQLFVGRCTRHIKIRDHPMFRAFLEASSPVFKNLKTKNLPPKFKCSKNTDKNYRPIPEDRLMRASDYFGSMSRSLKSFAEKTGQHVKLRKQTEALDNKAGYYETWRAIANQQPTGSYLHDRMRMLADTMQSTESEVQASQKEAEQNFRVYIKSLFMYEKAACDYVQLVKDLDETAAHWAYELEVAQDTLNVKQEAMNGASQRAIVPEVKPIEFKEGEDMTLTLKTHKKAEQADFKAYKSAQSEHKKLYAEVQALEKKIEQCSRNLEGATRKRDQMRANYWDELLYFDYLKDCELQLVHLIWIDRQIEAHEKSAATLHAARALFSEPVDRNARNLA